MIVKHSGCPKLSWKTFQLFLRNGNIQRSLDFTYSTLLSYGIGMGAKIICLKTFILHRLWVSLGSPCPFWCGGVVGPKPFPVAQCVLSTHHKTALQTEDTACLQIGDLFWYPSEGTLEITLPLLPWLLLLPLGYSGGCGWLSVVFISLGTLIIRFKLRDRRYTLFVLILFLFVIAWSCLHF